MITFILIQCYLTALFICVCLGKKKRSSFIVKSGLVPGLNIIVALCQLEQMINEWSEK